MLSNKQPLLIIVSAPSGAGKSTLCKMLLKEMPDKIRYSVSCTTRPPRGKEKNGEAYFFLTKEEFERGIAHNQFLEYALVHNNYYGTLEKTVRDALEKGMSIIMDIDVQGRDQIFEKIHALDDEDILKKAFFDIFIEPPNMEELEKRLRVRGEDTDDVIAVRMKNATEEIAAAERYQHVIVNGEINEAYANFKNIIMKGK